MKLRETSLLYDRLNCQIWELQEIFRLSIYVLFTSNYSKMYIPGLEKQER